MSDCIFGLISSFLISHKQLWVLLDRKSLQEYLVNAGVPQSSILDLTLFLLYSNDFSGDVISNIAIDTDYTTLYSKCGQTSYFWLQLELTLELETDQQGTVDYGKNWLVDFNAGNTKLGLLNQSNNSGTIDVKMGGSALKEK